MIRIDVKEPKKEFANEEDDDVTEKASLSVPMLPEGSSKLDLQIDSKLNSSTNQKQKSGKKCVFQNW